LPDAFRAGLLPVLPLGALYASSDGFVALNWPDSAEGRYICQRCGATEAVMFRKYGLLFSYRFKDGKYSQLTARRANDLKPRTLIEIGCDECGFTIANETILRQVLKEVV